MSNCPASALLVLDASVLNFVGGDDSIDDTLSLPAAVLIRSVVEGKLVNSVLDIGTKIVKCLRQSILKGEYSWKHFDK